MHYTVLILMLLSSAEGQFWHHWTPLRRCGYQRENTMKRDSRPYTERHFSGHRYLKIFNLSVMYMYIIYQGLTLDK